MNQFKNYILLAALALSVGCVTSPYSSTTMVQIKDKRNYEPINAKGFEVEDKNLLITYKPDIVEAGISLQFKNKTEKPVKIIWDESSYISPDNKSQKIFHSGVKIIDRTNSQPPTLIPPQGAADDTIVPTDSVSWELDAWRYSPLCGTRSIYTHELDDSLCLNKTFGFYITYEVEGKKTGLNLKYKFASKEPLPKK